MPFDETLIERDVEFKIVTTPKGFAAQNVRPARP
jgi:hypothetical protein